jgi:hypothetical protein
VELNFPCWYVTHSHMPGTRSPRVAGWPPFIETFPIFSSLELAEQFRLSIESGADELKSVELQSHSEFVNVLKAADVFGVRFISLNPLPGRYASDIFRIRDILSK